MYCAVRYLTRNKEYRDSMCVFKQESLMRKYFVDFEKVFDIVRRKDEG